jgi:signal transduction histidine kinase
LRLQLQQVLLQDILQNIVGEVCRGGAHPRGRLQTQWPQEPLTLKLDPALLRHILTNLLSNAYKYSPDGSPVWLSAEMDGDNLVLTVTDHGIGIPAEDVERIFEGFRRAGNVGDISGTGLGLSIVKHCVHTHGGSISVQSQPGQGTAFTARLKVGG